MFAPIYDSASVAHPDNTFGKLDTDAEQAHLNRPASIRSIPTLNGVEWRHPRALP